MKIISTNIAKPTQIIWNGREETTGIYKTPTKDGIYLGSNGVLHDEVSDRKHHGGEFKACYLFSKDHYSFWKDKYPNLDWNWGMFGENLTISGLNENEIKVGNIYSVGEALIQITQPREPCYKLGLKFNSQNIIKEFLEHNHSGTYIRILTPGIVKNGDTFILKEKAKNSITTAQLYRLIFAKTKDQDLLKSAIKNEALPQQKRNKLAKFIK